MLIEDKNTAQLENAEYLACINAVRPLCKLQNRDAVLQRTPLFINVLKHSSMQEYFVPERWSVLIIYAGYREDQKKAFDCT